MPEPPMIEEFRALAGGPRGFTEGPELMEKDIEPLVGMGRPSILVFAIDASPIIDVCPGNMLPLDFLSLALGPYGAANAVPELEILRLR